MDSKTKYLLSLNLLLYVLCPEACDTCTNSSSPSVLTPPSGGGAYVAPSGGGVYMAPCPNNSTSPPDLTPPSSGGAVAPCFYNSSYPPALTPPSGGGTYVAPCPNNSSLSCFIPPNGTGGANVAPCSNNSSLSCFTPPSGGGANVAPCPRDALKLGICANLLGKSVGVEVGNSTTTPCCPLLAGLADLEVAVCFCTAIRANILGSKLDVPISLSLLLNFCGINPPTGFICA